MGSVLGPEGSRNEIDRRTDYITDPGGYWETDPDRCPTAESYYCNPTSPKLGLLNGGERVRSQSRWVPRCRSGSELTFSHRATSNTPIANISDTLTVPTTSPITIWRPTPIGQFVQIQYILAHFPGSGASHYESALALSMLAQVARSSRHAVGHLDHCILPLSWAWRLGIPLLSPFKSAPHSSRLQRPSLCSKHSFLRTLTTSTTHPRRYLVSEGRTTVPSDETDSSSPSSSSPRPPSYPFYLETGYSIFAKRPSRPFPPPFVSLPSGSFSDPLTTHNPTRGRRPFIDGAPILGITNGDDAIIISDQNFVAVNDGVGAWAQKERGHAALWSRLIAHYWAKEVERRFETGKEVKLEDLDPVRYLQAAYEYTKKATKGTLKQDSESESEEAERQDNKEKATGPKEKDPNKTDILGTTTAASALLHFKAPSPDSSTPTPIILATSLGDCKILLVRPSSQTILYRSTEQWHWFDCPRQLGTNSPDTPNSNAVCDTVPTDVSDVLLVLSDGVTDNLWEHEICTSVCESVQKWESGDEEAKDGVVFVARRLMNSAREVAMDPNAESPYMERAFDEGIAAEGGKLDDISVVVGVVRRRE